MLTSNLDLNVFYSHVMRALVLFGTHDIFYGFISL